MPSPTASVQPPARLGLILRLAVLGFAALAATVLFVRYRQQLSLNTLAARETELRAAVAERPAAALAIAFVAYVAVTGLSLPGATAMSVVCGWLFGFWRALVLVSFASTAGATLAFLLSRYLLGDWIQSRYGGRLQVINAAIDREGAFYLFTLRLIPQVPFFVINATMGLTRIRVWTFWWVSQLGMLPGTIVFVLAGASAPNLKTVAERGLGSLLDWRLIAALVLLGVLPLAIKWLLGFVRGRRQM
jgi:uncharacterized membrane protein YdjX (TVP38/TMEM64 family)